jgi:hypothetical protein
MIIGEDDSGFCGLSCHCLGSGAASIPLAAAKAAPDGQSGRELVPEMAAIVCRFSRPRGAKAKNSQDLITSWADHAGKQPARLKLGQA